MKIKCLNDGKLDFDETFTNYLGQKDNIFALNYNGTIFRLTPKRLMCPTVTRSSQGFFKILSVEMPRPSWLLTSALQGLQKISFFSILKLPLKTSFYNLTFN